MGQVPVGQIAVRVQLNIAPQHRLGLLPQVVAERQIGQPHQRRLGCAGAGPLKRPVAVFGHAQAHENVAQIHLHLGALVLVLRLLVQAHHQQGLTHGFQCPRRIAPLQPVLGHAPMHLVVFVGTRRRQGAVVFRRRRFHLALVLEHSGHGQPGLEPLGLQRDGAAVAGQGLLVHPHLPAQMTRFQPGTVIARKCLEHLGKAISCGLMLAQHDQAARPLQSRWLHLGRFFQGSFKSGAGLEPLPRLEMCVALVERLGCSSTDLTNIVVRLDIRALGLWGLGGVHQDRRNS